MTGVTSILKRPGYWLKPKGSGNCWTILISPGGVAHVDFATISMLERALLPEVRMKPKWNVDVDQKSLLVVNNYPQSSLHRTK